MQLVTLHDMTKSSNMTNQLQLSAQAASICLFVASTLFGQLFYCSFAFRSKLGCNGPQIDWTKFARPRLRGFEHIRTKNRGPKTGAILPTETDGCETKLPFILAKPLTANLFDH